MSSSGPGDELTATIAEGRRFRAMGELGAAVQVFTRAHERFPVQARPLVERGAILILQHRYDESRADYAAAGRLEPGYPGLDSYVAELDLYTGRAAEALALSEQAAVRALISPGRTCGCWPGPALRYLVSRRRARCWRRPGRPRRVCARCWARA